MYFGIINCYYFVTFPGWAIIPAYCAATAIGIHLYKKNRAQVAAEDLENNTATIAIMPLIIAEKDRV